MHATRLAIPEVVLLEPKVFGDDRGFFFESFKGEVFDVAVDMRRHSPAFGKWVAEQRLA